MRIGHYMHNIWDRGGIASYIERISAAQRAGGHHVVYFDDTVQPRPPAHGAGDTIYTRDMADLAAQAVRLGLDIVHAHTIIEEPVPSRVPVIRTVHGHWPYCPSGTRYLLRPDQPCPRTYHTAGCLWGHLVDHCGSVRPHNTFSNFRNTWRERRTLRHIPVATGSRFVKQQMVRAGYHASLIHVLPLPAPDVIYTPPPVPEGVARFVFLGRLVPEKGARWLLEAASQTRTSLHIDVAGVGPQLPSLSRLVDRLGLRDRVTFHGWLGTEGVENLLAQARALVVPSVWHEPVGLVSLEAMAHNRAVIASRVGGIPEIVRDTVTGLLLDAGDVSGLARAMDRLAQDRLLAQRLGDEGSRLASRSFSLREHTATLIDLYRDCIAARQIPLSIL